MNPIICSLLVASVLLFLPSQGHALSITVGSATVNVGDTFTINLNVAGAVDLTSWQFDLNYNPLLLQANVVTEGPFLASGGPTLFVPPVFIDNVNGLISGVTDSLLALPGVSGNGVLATVEFTALQRGPSSLITSGVFLNFSDSGFTVTDGSVCVRSELCSGTNPVPEPGSGVLLLLGGLTLWGLRRWSNRIAA
jgi:hypothetical protein